jgi:predicted DNA-binding transcriptional regulator AlpA
MSFVPSVRECLQRLDRMRDTGSVIAAVDLLNSEVFQDEPASELTAARQRLADLHQLCLQMAANMSGGHGVPPTPAVRAPADSKPSIGTWHQARVAKAKHEARAAPRSSPTAPPGMVGVNEFAVRLGMSRSYFYAQVHKEAIPKPDQGGRVSGRPAFWHEAIVVAVVASRVK